MNELRISYITDWLERTKTAWPLVVAEIDAKVGELTVQLINKDNEETRGRIKALRDMKELPETLLSELEGMRAPLSEEDGAG